MTDEQILILLAEWGLVEYSIAEEDMINFVRSIRREALADAATFIRDIAAQKPEKPDYWSSCGQCEHNIELAQDLRNALSESGDERC